MSTFYFSLATLNLRDTVSLLDFSRFDRLRPVIQQLLLCHNLPLFIQLMLGNHLGGLSTDSSGVVGTSSSKKPKLSLFLSGTKLEEYLQLVDQLKVLTNLQDEDQESVLAHVVLFNTVGFVEDFRDKEIFDDLNLINEMIFDIFVKKSDANFKRQNLIKILSQMALFCTYNIDWDDKAVKTHPTRDLIMTYTLEEESWLNHQLSLVESAFRSVPAGKEIMHNYMMHSLGVPLPGDHMPNCFKMLLERVRKLFFIHPEFEELPVSVQRGLLKNHSDTALGLTAIRSESRNAIEQIQDGLGVLDEKIWRENYLPIFDSPSKIAKVSSEYMFDDATQFGQFVKLISNTRILVDHPDFYKLSLLFSITKQGKVRDELSNLHFKYKMIMRRRLEWNQGPMP